MNWKLTRRRGWSTLLALPLLLGSLPAFADIRPGCGAYHHVYPPLDDGGVDGGFDGGLDGGTTRSDSPGDSKLLSGALLFGLGLAVTRKLHRRGRAP